MLSEPAKCNPSAAHDFAAPRQTRTPYACFPYHRRAIWNWPSSGQVSNCDQTLKTLNERILILNERSVGSLTAVRKTTWIPSMHSRKSVLFPILNLNSGRTLHNQSQDAGSPMTCTTETARH
jgi:hypothetical protein